MYLHSLGQISQYPEKQNPSPQKRIIVRYSTLCMHGLIWLEKYIVKIEKTRNMYIVKIEKTRNIYRRIGSIKTSCSI